MAHTESIHTLTTWDAATVHWDENSDNSIRDCLNSLVQIEKPNSKILYNIGCAHLRLGNHSKAEQTFTSAISKDEHMAIAYFQRGCVQVKANRLRDALLDFEECQKRFRARTVIDYSQLGLKYKLYMCEARHNCGVVEAMQGNQVGAQQHLEKALKDKVELRHKTIAESLQDLKSGKMPELIEVPHEAIYRPPKGKLANLGQKDYLGKAKVISAVDEEDKFSGFVGPRKMEEHRNRSPSLSPANTPPTQRHFLRPAARTPERVPSPTPPSKAQLTAASRALSPKLKRMNLGNKNGTDDGLKTPPRGAPLLPPRSNGQRRVSEGVVQVGEHHRLVPGTRRGSEGVVQVGEHPRLAPGARRGSEGVVQVGEHPRLAPGARRGSEGIVKVGEHLRLVPGARRGSEGVVQVGEHHRLAPGARRGSEGVVQVGEHLRPPPRGNGARRGSEGLIRVGEQLVSARLPPPPSRPPPKLDRKPLPQLPTELTPPLKEEVEVELHCNTTKVIRVLPRSPLAELVWAACTAFSLQDDSIHLWYRKCENDELKPILTEAQMQDTWGAYSGHEPLQLWCYSKQ